MEADAAAEAVEALTLERLATSGLLTALREAQAQHGLRHGDYARYRRVLLACARSRPADAKPPSPLANIAPTGSTDFIAPSASCTPPARAASSRARCARRRRRTRGAPWERSSAALVLTPPRRSHLLLPLTNAERAWAYAMELKAAFARGGEDSARKRHHAIKRLAKAASWAAQLAALAAARADARTALEADAYSSWMVCTPLTSPPF